MYARVSTYDGGVEDYDASLDAMRSDIAPRVRAMEGSVGLLSMIDRSTGRALSITLWESEEAMAASREAANQVRSQAAASMGSRIVDVTEFEVGLVELP